MEYTTNYHLPQWVESDRIMMGDFNQMCSDMEAGLTSNAQAAAAAQTAAGNAQNAAENAQASADAVQDAYTPHNQPYAVGSYTGTDAEITITLGFRPKFLIIGGMVSFLGNDESGVEMFFGIADGTMLSKRLTFTDTGFIARAQTYSYDYYPNFTEAGRAYSYIAFR